jgi:hypothetical protein
MESCFGLGRGKKKPFFFFFSACGVAVLGGYDMEEKAARAYDLAALKYWGPSTHINFPVKKKEKLPLFTLSFLFFFYRDTATVEVTVLTVDQRP